MKKMSYILFLGLVCCILGGALSVLGYAKGGMDYVRTANALPQSVVDRMGATSPGKEKPGDNASLKDSISSADRKEYGDTSLKTSQGSRDYTFQLSKKKLQGFDAIQGDLKHIDMKIIPSDNENAYIDYILTAKKDSNPLNYQIKNSVLILSEREGVRNSYYKFVRLGKTVVEKNTNLVTLYLPKKQLQSLTLTLGEGDISIKGLDTKTAGITLRDGDMQLEASSVKGGNMDAKNGDYLFDDVTCENCKLSAVNGDFECNNFTMKKSELSAGSGDFIFEHSNGEDCKYTTEDGDFECSGFMAQNSTLYSENGDISIEQSTLTDCSLNTDCGDIFVEDAAVSGKGADSDTGDLYFTRSVVKNCEISTDCGDIDGDNLQVDGNVTLAGEESDIWVSLEASCKTKINIYAYTEDGSLEKSGKYKGKVRKRGDSRTYSRDTGVGARLRIVTEEGDITLE